MCKMSLERSLNVECNHGKVEPFEILDGTKKFIFLMTRCETPG